MRITKLIRKNGSERVIVQGHKENVTGINTYRIQGDSLNRPDAIRRRFRRRRAREERNDFF